MKHLIGFAFIAAIAVTGCGETPSPVTASPEKPKGYTLSARETAIMDMILAREKDDFGKGKSTVIGSIAGYTKVSASQVAETYDANEIQGDMKYKGKNLVVVGTITGISSNIMDKPAISFDGPNEFMTPIAVVADPDLNRVAELRKGESLALVCVGGGEITGRAMFNDCVFPERAAASVVSKVKYDVSQYLAGNGYQAPQEIIGLVAFTLVAESLVKDGTLKCEAGFDYECSEKLNTWMMESGQGVFDRMRAVMKPLAERGIYFPPPRKEEPPQVNIPEKPAG